MLRFLILCDESQVYMYDFIIFQWLYAFDAHTTTKTLHFGSCSARLSCNCKLMIFSLSLSLFRYCSKTHDTILSRSLSLSLCLLRVSFVPFLLRQAAPTCTAWKMKLYWMPRMRPLVFINSRKNTSRPTFSFDVLDFFRFNRDKLYVHFQYKQSRNYNHYWRVWRTSGGRRFQFGRRDNLMKIVIRNWL
jgi:hypothetical protein